MDGNLRPCRRSPMERLYLDHAASAPLAPGVAAGLPEVLARYGNPSSLHEEGLRAKALLDDARAAVAEALGCRFAELLFTSGGTEAANLAILGALLAHPETGAKPGGRVLLSAADHKCVVGLVPTIARLGFRPIFLPVDAAARLDLDALERELKAGGVALVAAMHVNNELGTASDVAAIAALCQSYGALFACDVVGSFAKDPEARADRIDADLLWLSGHKIGALKGIGALFVRAGTRLVPWVRGGEQERELRGGTENVVGAWSLGAALAEPAPSPREARDRLWDVLVAGGAVPTVPDRAAVAPGHAHFRFPDGAGRGLDAETLLARLDGEGVAASSGAACSSGSVEPSHVLLACGLSEREAKEGVRFSFGRGSTVEEAERAASLALALAADIHARRGDPLPLASGG